MIMRPLVIATVLAVPAVSVMQGEADMSIKAEAARMAAVARIMVVYQRARAAMTALNA